MVITTWTLVQWRGPWCTKLLPLIFVFHLRKHLSFSFLDWFGGRNCICFKSENPYYRIKIQSCDAVWNLAPPTDTFPQTSLLDSNSAALSMRCFKFCRSQWDVDRTAARPPLAPTRSRSCRLIANTTCAETSAKSTCAETTCAETCAKPCAQTTCVKTCAETCANTTCAKCNKMQQSQNCENQERQSWKHHLCRHHLPKARSCNRTGKQTLNKDVLLHIWAEA